MNFTQQLLAELFTKAVNFKTVTVKNVSQGSTINVSLGYGSVRAQALQDISGDCIVFQTDQGNWYLIGNSVANQNSSNRTQIVYRKTGQKIELDYPVITLLGVEADIISIIQQDVFPGTDNVTEFWLTGGKYKKKKVEQLNVKLVDNFITRYAPNGSNGAGFVTNLGNGKFYAATNIYIEPAGNTQVDTQQSGYRNNRVIKFFKNAITTVININVEQINQEMHYLGNGIWQSVPEDGASDMFTALERDIIFPFFVSGVPLTRISVLPRASNAVVYDRELHFLNSIVNFETFSKDAVESNPSLENLIRFANRSIECPTYLPNGNRTFTYTAARDGTYPSIGNPMGSLTYTENTEGEVLIIAWDKQYITHEFNIQRITNLQLKSPNAIFGNPDYGVISTTSSDTSTETIKLRTFGDIEDNKTITLETDSKYFIVGMTPTVALTIESTNFTVNYNLFYEDVVGSKLNPFMYVGENIITSYAISNKKPYLIKGTLESVTLVPVTVSGKTKNRMSLNFTITSKKVLPKAVYTASLEEYKNRDGTWGLPINAIILDNGNFWNYWLLGQVNNNGIYTTFTNNVQVMRAEIFNKGSLKNTKVAHPLPGYLICGGNFELAHPILMTDNLVNNKIYSVRNTYTIQDYYKLLVGDLLSEQIKFSQIPVAQWNITQDGKIKYSNTFLIDYEMIIPYFDGDPKALISQITVPLSYSYYPDK